MSDWCVERVYQATQAVQLVYTGSHLPEWQPYKSMIWREREPRSLTQTLTLIVTKEELTAKVASTVSLRAT
jgi:hypothetical protein